MTRAETKAWIATLPRATCQGRSAAHRCPLCDDGARSVLFMNSTDLAAFNVDATQRAFAALDLREASRRPLRHGPRLAVAVEDPRPVRSAAAPAREPERIAGPSQEQLTEVLTRASRARR